MKNLTRFLLFVGTMLVLMFLTPLMAMCQEVVQEVVKTSWIQNLWGNVKDQGIWVIAMYIAGIFTKNGWSKIIKSIAGKTTIITRELSHVSLAVSNFSDLVDKAIEADGKVDENSLKDAAKSMKTVIVEAKEAWVTIKPKPVVTE